MPLRPGRSNKVVSNNVKELVKAGYPQRQAVAVAMRKAGKARPSK